MFSSRIVEKEKFRLKNILEMQEKYFYRVLLSPSEVEELYLNYEVWKDRLNLQPRYGTSICQKTWTSAMVLVYAVNATIAMQYLKKTIWRTFITRKQKTWRWHCQIGNPHFSFSCQVLVEDSKNSQPMTFTKILIKTVFWPEQKNRDRKMSSKQKFEYLIF